MPLLGGDKLERLSRQASLDDGPPTLTGSRGGNGLSDNFPAWAAWLALGVAICCEIVGAYYMKTANGFNNLRNAGLAFLIMGVNVACTIVMFYRLELAVGWAVFTALELSGTITVGVVLLHETLTTAKLLGVGLACFGTLVLVVEEQWGWGWLFGTTMGHQGYDPLG